MNSLRSIPVFCLVIVFGFTSCGDDGTESIILGNWYGTTIARSDCNDFADDGPVETCGLVNVSECISCVKLNLERNNIYSLETSFDLNNDSENGTYDASEDLIVLTPNDGTAYDLPISDLSELTMKIALKRDAGCIANITMKKTTCE